MERYEDAQAALLEGLSLEPGHTDLQVAMAAVREALSSAAHTSLAQAPGPTRSASRSSDVTPLKLACDCWNW